MGPAIGTEPSKFKTKYNFIVEPNNGFDNKMPLSVFISNLYCFHRGPNDSGGDE